MREDLLDNGSEELQQLREVEEEGRSAAAGGEEVRESRSTQLSFLGFRKKWWLVPMLLLLVGCALLLAFSQGGHGHEDSVVVAKDADAASVVELASSRRRRRRRSSRRRRRRSSRRRRRRTSVESKCPSSERQCIAFSTGMMKETLNTEYAIADVKRHFPKVSCVKVYHIEESIVGALVKAGMTSIQVAIDQRDVPKLAGDSKHVQYSMLYSMLEKYAEKVHFTVAVGNEPVHNHGNLDETIAVMETLKKGLGSNPKLSCVRLTVPFSDKVMSSPYPVCKAHFKTPYVEHLKKIISIIESMKNGGSFQMNLYPVYTHIYAFEHTSLKYTLGQESGTQFHCPGEVYDSVMDLLLTALKNSLKGIGASNTLITIGETGWPTDGCDANPTCKKIEKENGFHPLTVKNAKDYYAFVTDPEKVKVPTYYFEVFDEHLKHADFLHYENHFGILREDGTLKFSIPRLGTGPAEKPLSADEKAKRLKPKGSCCFWSSGADKCGTCQQKASSDNWCAKSKHNCESCTQTWCETR